MPIVGLAKNLRYHAIHGTGGGGGNYCAPIPLQLQDQTRYYGKAFECALTPAHCLDAGGVGCSEET